MDIRQLAVLALAGFSFLWLVSNVFIHEIGRSWRIVDELPTGGLSSKLFQMGVLRPRARNEQFPKMLQIEKGLFGLSCLSILLGFFNFASAYMCTAFSAQMSQATCEYGAEMAKRCAEYQTSCFDTECGGANYLKCGTQTCQISVCKDALVDYLRLSADSSDVWEYIDGEMMSIQAIGSSAGFVIPWVVLGTASLVASSRSNRQSQRFTAVVSAIAGPVYIALAAAMLNYSAFIRSFCKDHRAGASYECADSVAEGLYSNLCQTNELGVEATLEVVLLSTITLILQAITCITYASIIYAYRHSLLESTHAHQQVAENTQTLEQIKSTAERTAALVKRQADAHVSLVHPHSFLPLPGLLQVFRGHKMGVKCMHLERVGGELRVFTGGADGTVRMWNLRSGQPLMVIQAHESNVAALDVFAIAASKRLDKTTDVKYQTVRPKWAAGNALGFHLENTQKIIGLSLYGWTKEQGDVLLGCSSVLLHDVLRAGLEKGVACSLTIDLPLILLQPTKVQIQRAAKADNSKTELDLIHELNSPSAASREVLNVLAASTAARRTTASDLDYQATGSIQVKMSCRPAEMRLDVEVLEAQVQKTNIPARRLNPYCLVSVKDAPQQRIFTAGNNVARMWDVQSQRLISEFVGHSSYVSCVLARCLHERDYLFTGSLDKTARMWDIATGQVLRVFGGHLDAVTSMYISDEVSEMKKAFDVTALRGKARLQVKTTYTQNADLGKDLEVEILSLEGLPLESKGSYFHTLPKVKMVVSMSPGESTFTIKPKYDAFDQTWHLEGMRHSFANVNLTDELEIMLLTGTGKKEAYLGHIETTVEIVDRRICTEVGLDSNELTSYYTVLFDQRHKGHLFTGAGLADGQIRMFDISSKSGAPAHKTFIGHTQSVTGLEVCDVYGLSRLVSCSWDGTCKVWSYLANETPTCLKSFQIGGEVGTQLTGVTSTYINNDFLWIVVACQDRAIRMLRVNPDTITERSWRKEVGEWLDRPQVFGVILFCIALDVVTGVVTDFAIADEDKDCFGRDSRGSFLVTATVLSVFCLDLILRMITQQSTFWFPLKRNLWNYAEVLIVFGSAGIAAFKAYSDAVDEAPFPPGAETPVVTCTANPELCEGYCVDENSGSQLSVARQGLTASRIISRVAISLRLVRSAFRLARIARSYLVKNVAVWDGHERSVNGVALCKLDGQQRMLSISDDSYLRLWDVDPHI
eukprot:CAMPEP_0173077400 /NCGR_PEP_ID=MMETSP1102-20130122/13200_1 /TAXON_ID=49646 /ORGANISM="Geminigera sp., Strain Caron Lab Isolate" /LENGTH=1208 /DNA_ID=CAMNT_0013947873 /DNA_START=66 /DNA_END=3692 /DNA_ORIENTATION=-